MKGQSPIKRKQYLNISCNNRNTGNHKDDHQDNFCLPFIQERCSFLSEEQPNPDKRRHQCSMLQHRSSEQPEDQVHNCSNDIFRQKHSADIALERTHIFRRHADVDHQQNTDAKQSAPETGKDSHQEQQKFIRFHLLLRQLVIQHNNADDHDKDPEYQLQRTGIGVFQQERSRNTSRDQQQVSVK